MFSVWVKGGWVGELTIMVLGVDGGLSGLGNEDELINVLLVGEVLVKVVLEVLNQGHVLLDEIVSSNSLEGESLIVELISIDSNLWVFTLSLHFGVDFHGVVVVLLVEVSREVVQLLVQSGLINLEWLGDAWSLGSWEGSGIKFHSLSGEEKGDESVFHY